PITYTLLSPHRHPHPLPAFPTRRSSDLSSSRSSTVHRSPDGWQSTLPLRFAGVRAIDAPPVRASAPAGFFGREHDELEPRAPTRSEEHTSELQSRFDLVCRLLLEKKKLI